MVPAALACLGHLPGGARSPWRGDSAPVVRQGHRPHHSVAAGTVLMGYARSRVAAAGRPGCPAFVRLVCQARTHFHRCHRSGTPASVVRFSDFIHIGRGRRCGESPATVVQPPCGFPCVCGLRAPTCSRFPYSQCTKSRLTLALTLDVNTVRARVRIPPCEATVLPTSRYCRMIGYVMELTSHKAYSREKISYRASEGS